jgi:hypothetical protein
MINARGRQHWGEAGETNHSKPESAWAQRLVGMPRGENVEQHGECAEESAGVQP